MTTFDQRYDAWINGRMPADEAEAFERELDEHVISDEEMNACLTDTARLSELFRGDFPAPVLPNEDFLNNSIMRQILEDQAAEDAARLALLKTHRERPAGFMDKLVAFSRLLRAPRLALPIGALALVAVLGVMFMRPGADVIGGAPRFYAMTSFENINLSQPGQIWAGSISGHDNVLWVDGLDWIPGDSALN
jgi:hypothetical protein